jgi:hypothetical protein
MEGQYSLQHTLPASQTIAEEMSGQNSLPTASPSSLLSFLAVVNPLFQPQRTSLLIGKGYDISQILFLTNQMNGKFVTIQIFFVP